MSGILATGATAVGNIAEKVNVMIKKINDLADGTDFNDPKSAAKFQTLMLTYQSQLDSYKKMMDAVEQGVRQFYRP